MSTLIQVKEMRARWLLLFLAAVISVIVGVATTTFLTAVVPFDRGWTLPISFLSFPLISGVLLVWSMSNPRPWRNVGVQLLAGIAFGVAGWLISSWRWPL